MGIKTKFNPMGGMQGENDKGQLSLWRYSNSVIADKTLLYNYIGSPSSGLHLYAYRGVNAWDGRVNICYVLNYPPQVGGSVFFTNFNRVESIKNVTNNDYFCGEGSESYHNDYYRDSANDTVVSGVTPLYAYWNSQDGTFGYFNSYPPTVGQHFVYTNGVEDPWYYAYQVYNADYINVYGNTRQGSGIITYVNYPRNAVGDKLIGTPTVAVGAQ